jgi:hypothetical protein
MKYTNTLPDGPCYGLVNGNNSNWMNPGAKSIVLGAVQVGKSITLTGYKVEQPDRGSRDKPHYAPTVQIKITLDE